MARNPLTAVPAARSSLPLLKIRRRLVVGLLCAGAATGVLSGIAWATADKTPPPAQTLPDQAAIALARTVVDDFLAARKSAVAAAKDVNTDFSLSPDLSAEPAKPLAVSGLSYAGTEDWQLGDGTKATTRAVQETFTATIGESLYRITVPMVAARTPECQGAPAGTQLPERCWLLGAAPALTPAPLANGQGHSGIDYGDLFAEGGGDSLLPTQGYRDRIKSWATVFAAAGKADPKLLDFTADDGSRTYSGLGGWSLVGDPQIKSAVPVEKPYRGFIVRVGLVLRSPAANGPTLSTDYDLYIRSDKSQTVPPVVAWGAAGSYKSLIPYFNADQR